VTPPPPTRVLRAEVMVPAPATSPAATALPPARAARIRAAVALRLSE
jgi:hypothetical protein